MKFVKKILILSDGSLSFCYELIKNTNLLVTFNIEDDKNFFLNKKKKKRQFDSKYASKFKKKYF